MNIINSL